jgi:hypothetical protein
MRDSAFVANGAVKNVATQVFYGDKYAAQSTEWNWGYKQGGPIAIGGSGQVPQQIDSVIDPNSSASYRRFSANDIVGHPASEAISGGYAGGKTGPFRYISATGDINGTITKSGRCQGAAANLTTNATINGTTTVSIPSISTLWIQPGDNITIVNGMGGSTSLDTQVSSVNYTANTMVVANAPSASASGVTLQNQACTFHEFAGAQTGTAAPSTGWWFANEKVWNTNTASGQPIYWVCTASGNPGTWVAGPSYGAVGLSLTANGAAVTPSSNVVNVAPGTGISVTTAGNNITVTNTGANTYSPFNGLVESLMVYAISGALGGVMGYSSNSGSFSTWSIVSGNLPLQANAVTASATSGHQTGWIGVSGYSPAKYPMIQGGVAYSASTDYTTGNRIWLGLSSCTATTLTGSANPNCHVAAIRYDTSASDSTYMCYAATTSSAYTATAITGATPATAFTTWSVTVNASGVTCTVGSNSVTVATNTPTATLSSFMLNTPLTNAVTNIRTNGWIGYYQNGLY